MLSAVGVKVCTAHTRLEGEVACIEGSAREIMILFFCQWYHQGNRISSGTRRTIEQFDQINSGLGYCIYIQLCKT